MKTLFVFLMIVGLVMAGSGEALVLAQTTYKLYATVKEGTVVDVTDFQLRYRDLDGDHKFSLDDDELVSFSGVRLNQTAYTQILGVPYNNFDSPFTDGDNPSILYWYFKKPSNVLTTVYINPNVWTFFQVPAGTVFVPGKTVVTDKQGDLLLRYCNHLYPDMACSLPPGEPLPLPGYFDISSAQITQVTGGLGDQVDLSIKVYALIPSQPPYPFVSYIWQFQGGCVGQNPQPGKDSISIVWQDWGGGTWEWRAYWYEITDCGTRKIKRGNQIFSFKFTDDGVNVRVKLDELLTATDEYGILKWHAAVRLLPFTYPPGCTETDDCWNTTAADYAPNVIEFLQCPPPPCAQVDEDFAYWEQR